MAEKAVAEPLPSSWEKSDGIGTAGILGDEERQVIERAVTQAANRHNLGLQGQSAALLAAPRLASCLTERRCQLSLAEENQATILLVLHAEATSMWRGGRDLVLRLTAIDTSVAEQAAMVERTCAACSPTNAGQLMGELATQVLGDAVGRPRGMLEVHSNPNGVDVLLRDKLLGQTPLKRPTGVGTFPIPIRKEGFGLGISALAINSHCVVGLGDLDAQCMRIYDTTAPGAALAAVGGAALLTGTVLLAWSASLK